jgi:hypothetical protein
MFQARGSEATASEVVSRHWVSPRAVLVLALVAGPAANGALLGCGAGNGDQELRPKVLTPTIKRPEDVVVTPVGMTPGEMPMSCPELMAPVSTTPAGTPDENGYISGPPQQCNGPNISSCMLGTPAPASGMLLNPIQYVMPAGTWGDAAVGGLTGGTSLYQDVPAAAMTQSVANSALHLQATIAPGGYSGVVFWFGPCVNASAFSGVQFSATGSLGGSTMIVKTQSSPDYPIDVTNTKGKCPFRVDANKYTECQQPTSNITTLPAAGNVELPWSSFTGGVPEPAIDPAQLLGFELQFSCPATATTPCALNLDLGTISFMGGQ